MTALHSRKPHLMTLASMEPVRPAPISSGPGMEISLANPARNPVPQKNAWPRRPSRRQGKLLKLNDSPVGCKPRRRCLSQMPRPQYVERESIDGGGGQVLPLDNSWQLIKRVKRGRRRKRPFKCCCSHTPWIGGCFFSFPKSVGNNDKKQKHAERANIGADGRHIIPSPISVRVIGIASRHPSGAQKMHRKEGDVGAHEGGPEMPFCKSVGVEIAAYFGEPIIEGGERGNTAPSDST